MSRAPESFVRATLRPERAYGPPRDPAAVPLHLNEAPGDLPHDLKARLCEKLLAQDWSKYPITDGARLAASLARWWNVEPAMVMAGNGSNELLQLLLFACIEPGDKVVLATPSFSLYELQAKALGAQVVQVPLRAPDGEFRFPIDALEREAEGAKLVLLASPNNPTGTTLGKAEVERLAQCDALLGIDEAYREFCDQDFAPLLRAHPRLVLFRTFSKAMAAASLRVGALVAAPALTNELRKLQLPYNLSMPACLIAEELIEQRALLRERVSLVQRERARIFEALRSLGLRVHPSGANFLFFEPRNPDALHAALFRRGVLIRKYADALRVSIGAPERNDLFLAALRAELA